ncbi:MAG: SMP-30/gluconolactonase/LRE family protein [Maribacter sp.]
MKPLFSLIIISALCLACKNNSQSKPKTIEDSTYTTIGYLEKIDDAFYNHISRDAKIEVISKGYVWTEGPVWVAKEQCLLFSDVPQNINYKWTEQNGAFEFLKPSGYTGKDKKLQGSNGMFLDHENNLILCQTGDRAIARYLGNFNKPKPKFEIIANQFNSRKFNAPNDLAIDKKGNIYFTDPNFGLEDGYKELDFEGVYMISNNGNVKLLTSKWPTPNGIGLYEEDSKLYIANSEPPLFVSYDISEDGSLTNEKIVLDLKEALDKSISKQKPDGMAIKKDGTIFLTGPDGVFIIDKNGNHLGTIKTDKLTSNCTFNEDESVLYVTCHELILRIKLN